MALESLQDLFLNELKDIYNAEKQIVTGPAQDGQGGQLAPAAAGLHQAPGETEGHVTRLERIFKSLGKTARGKKCKGMEGLLEEGKEILEEEGAGGHRRRADLGGPAGRALRDGGLRLPPSYAQLLGTPMRTGCWSRP